MKLKWIFPVILISLFLGGCNALPFLAKKQAAIQIDSQPQANVYLNGNQVGQTPHYNDKLKPGQATVRLVAGTDPSQDWQTQVALNPEVITVVNHQFGATSDESSTFIMIMEPIAKKDAGQIEVTTAPENVIVKVDGKPEGFSPLQLENVTAGDHPVALSAPGYQDLSFNVNVQNGYKVVVTAQLARASEVMVDALPDLASPSAQIATPSGKNLLASSSATPKPTSKTSPTPKTTPSPSGSPAPTKAVSSGDPSTPYIIIKDTGTGWLRVRSAPEVGDNEVAKVDVGEKFPYLDKTDDGWYKIEYETGKEGYIVSRYADLVE